GRQHSARSASEPVPGSRRLVCRGMPGVLWVRLADGPCGPLADGPKKGDRRMNRRIQMHNTMRVFCGGAVVVIAAGVVEAQAFVQPGNWPEPMFDKLHLDFGVVAKGAETKQRLKIVNTLPNPLHIHNAGTQCKCASARVLQDSIAPGETGYVEV